MADYWSCCTTAYIAAVAAGIARELTTDMGGSEATCRLSFVKQSATRAAVARSASATALFAISMSCAEAIQWSAKPKALTTGPNLFAEM